MWYIAAIVAVKGCNSLRACFLTSMEQEKFFKCNVFFDELFLLDFSIVLWILTRVSSTRSIVVFLSINNSIKLKYKVS